MMNTTGSDDNDGDDDAGDHDDTGGDETEAVDRRLADPPISMITDPVVLIESPTAGASHNRRTFPLSNNPSPSAQQRVAIGRESTDDDATLVDAGALAFSLEVFGEAADPFSHLFVR